MNITTKLLITAGLILAGAFATFMFFPSVKTIEVQSTGRALIGGPFTLVNHKGETVSDKNFRGKYMLVYFGYTFCPDVCPTELNIMGQALDELPAALANKITPIFISIDPERDKPKLIGEYVENFHKNFVGLTGSKQQIKVAAKAYRVFYSKNQIKGSPDYTMDHSSIIYLMDPQGKYSAFFSYGTPPGIMAKKIAKLIGEQS